MRWLVCVLLSVLVATCGQKGPLTLPEDEASAAFPAREAFVLRGVPLRAPKLSLYMRGVPPRNGTGHAGRVLDRYDSCRARRGGGIVRERTAGLT